MHLLNNIVYFPLLVLKGIYYTGHVFFLFVSRGLKQTADGFNVLSTSNALFGSDPPLGLSGGGAPKKSLSCSEMAVVVKTNGIPFWLVGKFTTHFRTYFTGDWDVHRGYGLLTHGQIGVA